MTVFGPRFLRALLLCTLLALAACSGRPLHTLNPQAVPAGLGDEQIATAIKAAMTSRRWTVQSSSRGKVQGKFSDGSASVTVDVLYSHSAISIHYVDSTGLGYEDNGGQPRIDKQYYRWIKYLRKSIHAQLRDGVESTDDVDDDSQG